MRVPEDDILRRLPANGLRRVHPTHGLPIAIDRDVREQDSTDVQIGAELMRPDPVRLHDPIKFVLKHPSRFRGAVLKTIHTVFVIPQSQVDLR